VSNRNDFFRTLAPGNGFCFVETDATIWVIREHAALGRFTIATSRVESDRKAPVFATTIIDWDSNVRGPINVLPSRLGPLRVTSASGRDDAVLRMAQLLNDRRRRYGVATGSEKRIQVSEVIFAPDEHLALFKGEGNEVVHVGPFPRMDTRDRCDRCTSQAYVAVRLTQGRGRLNFCAHHYNANAVALASEVDSVLDQRDELVAA